ncbi:hypothetical protein [Tenacibaculum sp. SG-28]|uniref:hypothetical protein n=1 Tax=Tenacibaculum sp. SG-28 TaxID=754426 RepID=UPI000CF3D86F|nr:hypothetical protein [Tenacibaculum sp. SG-28]PQJ20796.1 hypothetical protein BSU00_11000 [Tenacibaculum sp. SG-28]
MQKTVSVFLVFLWLLQSCSTPENFPENASVLPETEGYKMLLIGNSFFKPYAEKLDIMAIEAGFENHNSTIVFRGGENGRPINFWKDTNSDENNLIKATLDRGGIDFFGMTMGHETENPIEGHRAWINYALQNNPNITIFISLSPFDFPNGDPNGTRPDWNTFAIDNGFNSIQEFYDYYVNEIIHKEIVDQLRIEFPAVKIFTIPTGWATFELAQMNIDGILPEDIAMFGVKETSIFTDAKGHQGDIVRNTGGLIWLHSIYNVDLDTNTYETGFETNLHQIAKQITDKHAVKYTLKTN